MADFDIPTRVYSFLFSFQVSLEPKPKFSRYRGPLAVQIEDVWIWLYGSGPPSTCVVFGSKAARFYRAKLIGQNVFPREVALRLVKIVRRRGCDFERERPDALSLYGNHVVLIL